MQAASSRPVYEEKRLAVQVGNSKRSPGLTRAPGPRHHQPHLYVIDFTRPARLAPGIPPRVAMFRRQRLLRRLRRAGAALSWAAGGALLALLVIGGLAGLFH